jgi:hypothetical protein
MCGICQELKNPTLTPSLFAAGFAGLAAGVQLSYQRVRGGRDPGSPADGPGSADRVAGAVPSGDETTPE